MSLSPKPDVTTLGPRKRRKPTVTTTLDPDVRAAQKASGRTINDLLRQALGMDEPRG